MNGFFFFSSRRRHTRFDCDWSSDVCSSDLRCLSLPITAHQDGIRDAPPASPADPRRFLGSYTLFGVIARFLTTNRVDRLDRKSTRLNSSHSQISYAVFCLKKKTTQIVNTPI